MSLCNVLLRHRAQAKADARGADHLLSLEDVVEAWDAALRPKRARMLKSMHRGLLLRQGSSSVTATTAALYSESLLAKESTHSMTVTDSSGAAKAPSQPSSAEVR
jgi:hypothetical protein